MVIYLSEYENLDLIHWTSWTSGQDSNCCTFGINPIGNKSVAGVEIEKFTCISIILFFSCMSFLLC